MKTLEDGRPYCLVSKQDFSGEIYVHPELYNAIAFYQSYKATGRIELDMLDGNIRAVRGTMYGKSIPEVQVRPNGRRG